MLPCLAPGSVRKGGLTVRSGAIRGGDTKAVSLRGEFSVALLFHANRHSAGAGLHSRTAGKHASSRDRF
ncbi:hypothetical protein [Brevibacillus borstelensis]|uniref:hypothetical protein n=1 Tax=Brevibacillus borstelensis TaxID=45462 RepID=UPI0030BE5E25